MVFFQKNPVFFDWTSNIYDIFWVNKYIVPIKKRPFRPGAEEP